MDIERSGCVAKPMNNTSVSLEGLKKTQHNKVLFCLKHLLRMCHHQVDICKWLPTLRYALGNV
jgi:hypothetical protein